MVTDWLTFHVAASNVYVLLAVTTQLGLLDVTVVVTTSPAAVGGSARSIWYEYLKRAGKEEQERLVSRYM